MVVQPLLPFMRISVCMTGLPQRLPPSMVVGIRFSSLLATIPVLRTLIVLVESAIDAASGRVSCLAARVHRQLQRMRILAHSYSPGIRYALAAKASSCSVLRQRSHVIRAEKFAQLRDPTIGHWWGKVLKKASIIWKLFMLVMVGISAVYLCFVGVDWTMGHSVSAADGIEGRCPKSEVDNFAVHYPEPSTYSREECECTPVHYFVILSMQRSGSGWFETLLNDHPNISSHGEVFSVKERRENFSTIVETLDRVYNLDWASSAAKNECTAAVGFKWMLNQGAMEYRREVAAYMQQRGVSVILLLRRNTLRRLISILANAYDRQAKQLNGTHKSHVHSEEEAEMLAEFRPAIDVDHLVSNLQRVQQITSHAASVFNSSRLMVVYYEDVIQGKKSLLEIENFLGVPARKLESKQVKIHRKPLSQQIQNWSEVAKRLSGTEYETFLADDRYG